MKNLESIAEELFNKIRGRFPNVTIGNENGEVTNVPTEARFFDFEYKESDKILGNISVSIDENDLSVMYSNDFVANEDAATRNNWYSFLKELRTFSKKRMLNFDTRNITKSNLDRRDYNFLATNRAEEDQMNESKMYGTNKTSFQKIGNAKLSIKHTEAINTENATARSQKIGAIYVENTDGERFKYPFKHLSGARAMTRHVAEGGKPYDDFGKHITGLSEELAKLRKFNSYMNRSSVMAEGLSEYVEVVKERANSIKKEINNLQKESYYKESIGSFETPVFEEVPDDIKENWIDELTIKQFNEELSDVFPYIYKLVSEATRAKELGPEDLEEADFEFNPNAGHRDQPDHPENKGLANPRASGSLDNVQGPAETVKVRQGMTIFSIAQMFNHQNNMGGDVQEFVREIMQMNNISNPQQLQVGQVLQMPYSMGTGPSGASRGLPPGGFTNYESQLENEIEELMGQFSEKETNADEGNAYAKAVRQAKMNGAEKGDEVDGPDGEKIKIEQEDDKTPLGEFILSYFDYTTGQFPKGETAVLTMVEKDYGEHFIQPAKQFLEKINSRVSEVMGYREEEPVVQDNTELDSIRSLAGI
jgi:LysM repeat protein